MYPNAVGRGNSLNAVWGSSANDVFAVGESGVILHYDGNNWTEMVSGTFNELYGIWGIAENNIFAVGDNGTILHYDGKQWMEMESGTSKDISGIWGSSAGTLSVKPAKERCLGCPIWK